jgi:RNA polymerase sigma factor (sigma-70 family)
VVAVPSFGRASEIEAPPVPRETAAAGDLYSRFSERIYRYCYSRLRSREEAEDATQTTFLNAFRGLRRGVTPDLEQAWLYKIAENVCLTRQRSNVRRLRVESPVDLDPLHDVFAAPQRRRDELHGISDALAGLPEQQRRAILLREWQGLSYLEIAGELGITQSAVETLIFRARRSLAKGLMEPKRNRVGSVANLGSWLGTLKSLLFGASTAAKVAAVVAAGAAVAVGGVKAVQHRSHALTRNPVAERVLPRPPTRSDLAALATLEPAQKQGLAKARSARVSHAAAGGAADGASRPVPQHRPEADTHVGVVETPAPTQPTDGSAAKPNEAPAGKPEPKADSVSKPKPTTPETSPQAKRTNPPTDESQVARPQDPGQPATLPAKANGDAQLSPSATPPNKDKPKKP